MKAPPSGSPLERNSFFKPPAFRVQLKAGYPFIMVKMSVKKAITRESHSYNDIIPTALLM